MAEHLPAWTGETWKDYLYWQGQDRRTPERVNRLIQDVLRSPFEGIGRPEPLRENLAGFWSRRIDDTHRLVYTLDAGRITIIACRFHYQPFR